MTPRVFRFTVAAPTVLALTPPKVRHVIIDSRLVRITDDTAPAGGRGHGGQP